MRAQSIRAGVVRPGGPHRRGRAHDPASRMDAARRRADRCSRTMGCARWRTTDHPAATPTLPGPSDLATRLENTEQEGEADAGNGGTAAAHRDASPRPANQQAEGDAAQV